MLAVAIRKIVLTSLVSLGVSTGGLILTSAPAFGSAPEIPELRLLEVASSDVDVSATLNPAATEPHELGTYQYVYRATTSGNCKGAGETVFPEPPGMSAGVEHEELPGEFLGGLEAGTQYAICVVVTEPGKSEAAVSPSVAFTTTVPPEAPEVLPATEVTGSSATLNADLNPNNPGHGGETYSFVYRLGSSQCEGIGAVRGEEQPVGGQQDEAVSFALSGLRPRTRYVYCVRVQNAAFESAESTEQVFETGVLAPAIGPVSVSHVTDTGATLATVINPGGEPASYRIEYDSGKFTATQTLPAATVPIEVVQSVAGLSPETNYSGRVLAENADGADAKAFEFTTHAAPTETIANQAECDNIHSVGFAVEAPDCRAAELVSPPSETGEVYDPGGIVAHEQDITSSRPFRASASGAAVAYIADPSLTGGDGSSAKENGNQFLANRGASGWLTENISPTIREETGKREYEGFSADLSVGVLQSEKPLLAVEPHPQLPSGCSGLYTRIGGAGSSSYSSLFSETLSPAECGATRRQIQGSRGNESFLFYAGESANGALRVFQSPAALAAPAAAATQGGGNIYQAGSGGSVSVLNVLPNGEVEPDATVGGPSDYPENMPDLSDAMPSDGSRLFWSSVLLDEANAAQPKALYAREGIGSASSGTVQIDAAQVGAPGPSGGGQFWGASTSGDKLFFTDCNRLTTDATAVSTSGCYQVLGPTALARTGNDLYAYEYDRTEGDRLVDLTVDHDGSDPLGADVQGVIGSSENADYIYFVAGGSLGADPNSRGETPTPRTCAPPGEQAEAEREVQGELTAGFGCNLFVAHFNGSSWERPRYIAALGAVDDQGSSTLNNPGRGENEVAGDWTPDVGARTAEVAPNGTGVTFMSTQDLTGYDTSALGRQPPAPGAGAEVFVYSYTRNKVACASCNPEAEPPDPSILQSGAGYPTYLPVSSRPTFMRRLINNDGTRVFFDSSQQLTPRDNNHAQDVYEWEQEGTTSCPVSTSVFGGCVFLLSGGNSNSSSFFADASDNGEDVFLTHRGSLDGVGQPGSRSQLYDLRADGGEGSVSVGCTGSGCRSAPSSGSSFALPASAMFSGVGNFPQVRSVKKITKKTAKCSRGKKPRHGKCIKVKIKKKKAKKINHGKRSK